MRATKLVLTIKHLKYKERLIRLQLPTLRYRRTRGSIQGSGGYQSTRHTVNSSSDRRHYSKNAQEI